MSTGKIQEVANHSRQSSAAVFLSLLTEKSMKLTVQMVPGVSRGCLPPFATKKVMGIAAPLSVECVRDERQLLLRIASIVRRKDPDMFLSWDTQGLGLGYLSERGVALGRSGNEHASRFETTATEIDSARLLGRTPTTIAHKTGNAPNAIESAFPAGDPDQVSPKKSRRDDRWKGSGLGIDWDDRVGAGAASASIASIPLTVTSSSEWKGCICGMEIFS
jgi:hypothetical protein